MNVADWLRDLLAHITKDTNAARLLDDLAQLAAEQHEFISAHWKIMHKRCEHGSCKSLRMAAAFKEKYE